jgi:hypothetical protein
VALPTPARREDRNPVGAVSVNTLGLLDLATGSAVARRFRPRSTPERLRAFRAALFAAVALLAVVATVVLLEMHSTAVSVRDTAAPAYLDTVEVQAVLSDAHRAVWQSLRSGEAQFNGPGPGYEDDITTANQDLQQIAALEAPGSTGSSVLQTLTGQLVTYQGLVEQADATNRAEALAPQSSHDLSNAYLTYAGQSLQGPGGLLPTVNTLSDLNQQALNGQWTSLWVDPALFAAFVSVVILLLGSF